MSQIGGNRHNYMEYGQKQIMWGYDISCSKNNILVFSKYRDFPSIGFLAPPPSLQFCTPIPFSSRRARPPSLL